MGLFQKTSQHITISSEEQGVLEALISEVRVRKLKDTKISSIQHASGEWQCRIGCKQAEALYYQELLPLLYDSAETQSLQILLEFDDENKVVRNCPIEFIVSFDLNSKYAFGDKTECDLLQKMHEDISQNSQDEPAAVTYYIVSGGSVTMCIPCAEPAKMKKKIESLLKSFGIKRQAIKLIDRRLGVSAELEG